MRKVRVRLSGGDDDVVHKLLIADGLPDAQHADLVARAMDAFSQRGADPNEVVFVDEDGDRVKAQNVREGDELWVTFGRDAYADAVVEPPAKLARSDSSTSPGLAAARAIQTSSDLNAASAIQLRLQRVRPRQRRHQTRHRGSARGSERRGRPSSRDAPAAVQSTNQSTLTHQMVSVCLSGGPCLS